MKEVLQLSFDMAEATDVRLIITDLSGKQVFADQIGQNEGRVTQRLDVQELSQGIYILYLNTATERVAKKFVKVN